MDLYRITEYTLRTYHHGKGIPHKEPKSVFENHGRWVVSVLKMVQELLTFPFITSENEALAEFFTVNSINIDRYWKHAFLNAPNANHGVLLFTEEFRNRQRAVFRNGLYESTRTHLFERVPYLRRYTIHGEIYITSDGLPETPDIFSNMFLELQSSDFSVDTMLLDGYSLVCLRVDRDTGPFDVSGHYPILAGYGWRGKPLYVAAVRSDFSWYLTCVPDGASAVTYLDEIGEPHTVNEFFVLALRQDPVDCVPPYPPTRQGAMDPTGPLSWLRFWPSKDPEYYEDVRLTDDRILESFLNETFRC
ncbi:hypothetical protein SCHPADRAFT_907014, partial [Schizopora paradoxa]